MCLQSVLLSWGPSLHVRRTSVEVGSGAPERITRTRGENASLPMTLMVMSGTSPRRRTSALVRSRRSCRYFPLTRRGGYAKSLAVPAPCTTLVRGENLMPNFADQSKAGPPPSERGEPERRPCRHVSVGTTSAHAGKTRTPAFHTAGSREPRTRREMKESRWHPRSPWDHPRTRRRTPVSGSAWYTETGLPTHARDNASIFFGEVAYSRPSPYVQVEPHCYQ